MYTFTLYVSFFRGPMALVRMWMVIIYTVTMTSICQCVLKTPPFSLECVSSSGCWQASSLLPCHVVQSSLSHTVSFTDVNRYSDTHTHTHTHTSITNYYVDILLTEFRTPSLKLPTDPIYRRDSYHNCPGSHLV